MKRRVGNLSGGWQRRLSIAMAMITEPELLFLDEPILGLDVIVRSELWDLIRGLKGKTTVVLTTHYVEETEALSDRIGIMKDGVLVSVGTADELRDQLNLLFGIGFLTILLLLLSAIQSNIPESLFEIERLTPEVTVFGFASFHCFAPLPFQETGRVHCFKGSILALWDHSILSLGILFQ